MRLTMKRILTAICTFSITLSFFAFDVGSVAEALESASDLVITEAYIDDISRSEWLPTTIDHMEYVELYNPTDEEINFTQNYSLYHYREKTDKEYSLPLYNQTDDVIIPANSSIILWGYNVTKYAAVTSAENIPDVDDFRDAMREYNSDIENINVYQMNTSTCVGFYNTYNGSFRLKDAEGNLICEAAYTPATDSADGKSMEFRIPSEGMAMTVYTQQATPSPGIVSEEQYTRPAVAADPVFVSVDAEDSYSVDEGFTVSASISDAQSATLFLKQSDVTAYQSFELIDNGDGTFSVDVPRSRLWGETLTWYLEAYNGTKTAQTEEATASVEYLYDATEQPQILITELKTEDTDYNYIELYNNSDSTINFVNYDLFYVYPSGLSYKKWTFDVNALYIESGQTLVVWINDDDKTVEQFNAHYGVDLVENESIIKVDYSGMSPELQRTVKLGSTYDNPVISATYHEDTADDTAEAATILYTYSRDNEAVMIKADTTSSPTPGTVESWQVPETRVAFDNYGGYTDDPSTMVLSLKDELPESIEEGKALNVAFNCYDTETGVNTIETYYKFDDDTEYSVKTDKTQRIANQFITSIPASEFLGHEKITFYVRAYNAFRYYDTDVYEVAILPGINTDGLSLNVENNQTVSGDIDISAIAGSGNTNISVSIDATVQTTESMLFDGAYFSYASSNLTSYYKNAITVGDDVIKLLSSWAGVNQEAAHIGSEQFVKNDDGDYEITVTLRAGTQGSPFETDGDDYASFTMSNMALYLPNGMFVYPDNGINYNTSYTIGDSSLSLDVHFTIPADQITSRGLSLDTTTLTDGEHMVAASTADSTETIVVIVDNDAPEISLGIDDGETLGSGDLISPQFSDSASGVSESETVALLDGDSIELPYTVYGSQLENGTHTLSVTCTDYAGHTTQKSVSFLTDTTSPSIMANDVTQKSSSASLSVAVNSEDSDGATVKFLKGQQFSLEQDNIEVNAGSGDDPLADTGKESLTSSSSTELPYQLFEVQTGNLNDEDTVEVSWAGASDANGILQMFVLNVTDNVWESIGTASDGTIEASFQAEDHVLNGTATILVQNRSEGSFPSVSTVDTSGQILASGEDSTSEWDGTGVPENYDFSFAWISDPQYYVESWPENFTEQNQWIVDHRDTYNIKYTICTGDLVDEWDRDEQWQIADEAMSILDDADMPNGVLAGNHDVASGNEEYDSYWEYFGQTRYEENSYYGGAYQDNLGHYDLISAGGQDFIILYMSWDVYQDEVDWMNSVLAQYPERKAIIALHRYLKQGGTLDYTGELVQNEVVAKNSNVFAVINGHYFGAAIKVDGFDDDGDGIKERKVYQICTDYQDASEGGSQYIKMLYFDLNNDKIYMNSYSPSLDDFNYFDNAKLDSYDIGTTATSQDIYELDVNFDTDVKTLETTSMTVSVYTDDVIGAQENVSGSIQQTWKGLSSNTQYWWYAEAVSGTGETVRTDLENFVTLKSSTSSGGNSTGTTQSSGNSGSITVTTSNNKTTATQTIGATAGSDGMASVSVTQEQITDMIAAASEKAQEQNTQTALEISVTAASGAKGVSVTIPQAAAASLVDGVSSLTISSSVVAVTFDETALSEIGKTATGDIIITAVSPDATAFSDKDKVIIGDRPIYELKVTSGNTTISSFGGGTATVSIPYSPAADEDINKIVVYYVSGNGEPAIFSNCVYDSDTETVRFKTNHFSSYAIGYHDVIFSDVSGWYEDYVNYLAARGIINGIGNGSFSPDANITRAEFVTILANLSGDDLSGYTSTGFSDVEAGSWFFAAIQWAFENDIASGYDGSFYPDANITREQMAVMLYRYAQHEGLDVSGAAEGSLQKFSDYDSISDWAMEPIQWAMSNSIVSGNNDGSFAPAANATRAQAAKMVALLMQGMLR